MPTDVQFTSSGTTCRGTVYHPASGGGDAPVIVMAHGLGGTQQMRLGAFAERFAAAGYVAMTFDYRTFGASDGEPRRWLSIPRQLADYRAAAGFAASLPGVDPSSVVLWGTSFSGGHVIQLGAERLPGVAAVVAQCPFTDGPASNLALGAMGVLRVAPFAVADEVSAVLRRRPVYVSSVGRPGTTALMTAPDAYPGVQALCEGIEPEPEHDVAARIGTRIGLYRPGRALRRASVPTLVAVCTKDTVAPAKATLRHARRASSSVEVREYPHGHFDIYVGDAFERVVADEVEFLLKVVPPA